MGHIWWGARFIIVSMTQFTGPIYFVTVPKWGSKTLRAWQATIDMKYLKLLPKEVVVASHFFIPRKRYIYICQSKGPFDSFNIYYPCGLRKSGFKNTSGNRLVFRSEICICHNLWNYKRFFFGRIEFYREFFCILL